MENKFDIQIFICLVVINKTMAFRDSYNLTKVLSWKFDIIDALHLTRQLIAEGLATETLMHYGIHLYEITDKGLKYLDTYKVEGQSLMLENYPDERDFISMLLAVTEG